ncbi:MAG: PqqD family peptide modification chaperone [Bacteroidetes bacterium]|nr:PqqD family peptide modification chaperone [Bacteroidota bacterium]
MERIYTRNQVVVLREEFDDWAVLYNPDNAEAVGTNPIGVEIWKNLDGKKNLGEIVAGIKQEYNNVSENVDAEVLEFIQKLLQRGLIGISSTL